MQSVNEIGVVFWAGLDPAQTLDELKGLGFRCGQLAIGGDLDLGTAQAWRDALERAEFTVYTVFAAFSGESYRDIPTVQQTVGFIPPATREEREERILAVSDFAAHLGVPGIATHIGFVPHDPNDPDYPAMVDLVRRICDHAAKNKQTFALETGQEPAPVLLDFFRRVERENLGINFDPANLILYGTGNPIEALRLLSKHVLSVHAKDGTSPPSDVPGALGAERPLGSGEVGMERFIHAIRSAGYRGPLFIERETEDAAERIRDIRSGAELLRRLTASQ